jgi:hypothetical protein
MEIVYCTQCGKVIPPGGVDEGKYFARGNDRICPACYHKLSVNQHSGGTALVEPLEEERRPPIMPSARRRSSGGSSAKLRAARPPELGEMEARTPTGQVAPVSRRKSASRTSSRLRAMGGSGGRSSAGAWIIVLLVVAAAAGVILALAL